VDEDEEFRAELRLRPYPLEWPELPGPPIVGDLSPPLPDDLIQVGRTRLTGLNGRPHLLFFWATWCLPCKAAVPEVMAYAKKHRLKVLAISDEAPATVERFLEARDAPFFAGVVADPRRETFISYGVSGTPTIIMLDDEGIVTFRQVGYNLKNGLNMDGWSWAGP
jgi:thiol-disulfide isomerase/thioredoxin